MGARLSYPSVNLSGKVAVVTGGNAGIGYETVKQLAVMGAHTIMACRSEEKAKAVCSFCLSLFVVVLRADCTTYCLHYSIILLLLVCFVVAYLSTVVLLDIAADCNACYLHYRPLTK